MLIISSLFSLPYTLKKVCLKKNNTVNYVMGNLVDIVLFNLPLINHTLAYSWKYCSGAVFYYRRPKESENKYFNLITENLMRCLLSRHIFFFSFLKPSSFFIEWACSLSILLVLDHQTIWLPIQRQSRHWEWGYFLVLFLFHFSHNKN